MNLRWSRVSSANGRRHVEIVAEFDGAAPYSDRVDLGSKCSRSRCSKGLASHRSGIEVADIEAELLKIDQQVRREDEELAKRAASDSLKACLSETPQAIKDEAAAMLRAPNLIRRIVDDIASLGVAGERSLTATSYLIGTSRLLPNPLAGIIQGLTASGKSYVADQTGLLFPPESVVWAHSITPQALVHMPPGSLKHRFVVAGERSRRQNDDTADATRALREMLSSGRLTKLMPVKIGGEIVTARIEQEGPISYIESTTLENILDEDANRCLILTTDERAEQTRRIIDLMAKKSASRSVEGCRPGAIIEKHHAAQRMLVGCTVEIPFAARLAERFPADRTDARRSFGHVLRTIEAVALLHQFQRNDKPEDGCTIQATRRDYRIARWILAGPITRAHSSGLSDAARRFNERLRTWAVGCEFTATDVVPHEKTIGDLKTIRDYIRALHDAGYLEQTELHRGTHPAKYKLGDNPLDRAAEAGLPKAEELFDE